MPTESPETLTARDGTRFQWHGDKQAPVIALIHGLGLNRHMWQWQIPSLSERYSVLTFDLMGHGDSPAPAAKPCLKMFSEQLVGILTDAKINQCAVLGFSLGGMIARRFAMDHGDFVSALAIFNSPHQRDEAAQRAIVERANLVREHGPSSTVDAALERWFTEDFRRVQPNTVALVRDWVLANNAKIYPNNYQVLADGVAELISPDPPIRCPTLVVTAEDDFGQPAQMAHAIAAEIPGARTVILSSLRHMALVESPQKCNSIILEFLRDIENTG